VTFPEAQQAVTNYPIAVLKSAPQADLAAKFQSLVTGDAGKKALQAVGFGTG
jgi:molybdate transport system substrate-binding protein